MYLPHTHPPYFRYQALTVPDFLEDIKANNLKELSPPQAMFLLEFSVIPEGNKLVLQYSPHTFCHRYFVLLQNVCNITSPPYLQICTRYIRRYRKIATEIYRHSNFKPSNESIVINTKAAAINVRHTTRYIFVMCKAENHTLSLH